MVTALHCHLVLMRLLLCTTYIPRAAFIQSCALIVPFWTHTMIVRLAYGFGFWPADSAWGLGCGVRPDASVFLCDIYPGPPSFSPVR